MSSFQRGNCLLAGDGRKRVEKLVEAVVPCEAVDQVAKRDTRPQKHGRTAENLWVTVNDSRVARHVRHISTTRRSAARRLRASALPLPRASGRRMQRVLSQNSDGQWYAAYELRIAGDANHGAPDDGAACANIRSTRARKEAHALFDIQFDQRQQNLLMGLSPRLSDGGYFIWITLDKTDVDPNHDYEDRLDCSSFTWVTRRGVQDTNPDYVNLADRATRCRCLSEVAPETNSCISEK